MADFFRQSGFSKYTVRTSVDDALADDPRPASDPFMAIISEKVVPIGKAEPGYPWDVSLAMGNGDRVGDEGRRRHRGRARRWRTTRSTDVIDKQESGGQGPGD